MIDVEPGENVTAILAAPDFENSDFLVFATRAGEVKKSPLNDFSQVRRNGLRAMTLEENDELLYVKHCRAGDDIILVTERGQSARFTVDILRTASRISGGVRGIRLTSTDHLASMDVVVPEAQLLVVSRNGYGKRTPLSAFPQKGRGIGGVRAFKSTSKTGPVAAARVVHGHEELMMISSNGIVIRTAIDTISEQAGRMTSGVRLMRLDQGDAVAAISILEPSPNGNGHGGPELLSDVPINADEPEVAAAALPAEAGSLPGTAALEDEDDLEEEEVEEQADEDEE